MKKIFFLLIASFTLIANLQEVPAINTYDSMIIPLSSIQFNVVRQFYTEVKSADGELRLLEGGKSIYIKDRYEVVTQVREFIDFSKRNQKTNVVIIEYLTSRFGINKHLENENDAKLKKPTWRASKGKVSTPTLLGFRAKGIELKKAEGPFSENDLIKGEELLVFSNTKLIDVELLVNNLRNHYYYLSDQNGIYSFDLNEKIQFVKSEIKIKITNLLGNRFGLTVIPYLHLKISGKDKQLIISSLAARVLLRNEEHFALGAYLFSQRTIVELFFGNDFFEDSANRNRSNCFIRCVGL